MEELSDGGRMRALALAAIGDLRLETRDVPQPARDQVLVRVAFCGVCGSDLPRIFAKGAYRFPTVCGHEMSGLIEACGDDVDDLFPGMEVVVFPLIWCGRCGACEQGRFVMCEEYDYLGSRSDGGFADFVLAPRRNILPLPPGVPLDAAAMVEPAAVALHAVRQAGGTTAGETVVVFGAGPIGLMVAQWARALGAANVLVADVAPEKLDLATELGFEMCIDSRGGDPVQAVLHMTGGAGAHLCVDAAGVPQTLIQALRSARRGGRAALLGNPSADALLPAGVLSQVMRREVSIHGVWNSTYSVAGQDSDWHHALDAMQTGRLNVAPLISHRVPLSKAAATLAAMNDRSMCYTKVLIHPDAQESPV